MTGIAFDQSHLWHPYTSMTDPQPVHKVVAAEGITLTLEDGTELIDGMSSWWCAVHGHRHPAIVGAMKDQLERMPHVMFGGLTHDPAIALGQALVGLLPEGLDRIFYCDSGSVAVEVAMKMAVQAQMGRGQVGRTRFATVRSGYHGDTWKAMSVCDPETGMHGLYRGAFQAQHFLPAPPVVFGADWPDDPAQNGVAALEAMLADTPNIAALILEPIVQGAGAMRFYHPQYLAEARRLCDAYGVFLIFDEIATGFGRSGRMFAMEHAGVTPDILCLGKALTGGHISFACTVATGDVAQAVSASEAGVFMHGPTFMGNPLACAAAKASLELFATTDWQARVSAIEAQLHAELAPAKNLSQVADVRVLGGIGVIEMRNPVTPHEAHKRALQTGVYLRPFAHNIYTMPPFVTGGADLSRITTAMLELAADAG